MLKLAKKDKAPKKIKCNTFRGLRKEQVKIRYTEFFDSSSDKVDDSRVLTK